VRTLNNFRLHSHLIHILISSSFSFSSRRHLQLSIINLVSFSEDLSFAFLKILVRFINKHVDREEYAMMLKRIKKFKLEIINKARIICDRKRKIHEIKDQAKCHEMWLLIILRMRKSCINDRTIAKIMIIREEFYSKNVMWSVLRYSTCSDQSHILIWRWIILIELIWWLQSLSRNSIIIKARNLIINWRLNDLIYLSIKSAVNTYIYHKMMRYWSHTEK
jgi:hypothetical protein